MKHVLCVIFQQIYGIQQLKLKQIGDINIPEINGNWVQRFSVQQPIVVVIQIIHNILYQFPVLIKQLHLLYIRWSNSSIIRL